MAEEAKKRVAEEKKRAKDEAAVAAKAEADAKLKAAEEKKIKDAIDKHDRAALDALHARQEDLDLGPIVATKHSSFPAIRTHEKVLKLEDDNITFTSVFPRGDTSPLKARRRRGRVHSVDETRRRRGCHVDIPRRKAAATPRPRRGSPAARRRGSSVATPRPRRGSSVARRRG